MEHIRKFLACACVGLIVIAMSSAFIDSTYSNESSSPLQQADGPLENIHFNVDAADVGHNPPNVMLARTGSYETSVLQMLLDNEEILGAVVDGVDFSNMEISAPLASAEPVGAVETRGAPVFFGGLGGGSSGSAGSSVVQLADGFAANTTLGFAGINPASLGLGSNGGSSSTTTVYTTEQRIITIEPLVTGETVSEVSVVPAPSSVVLAMLGFGVLNALHKRCLLN